VLVAEDLGPIDAVKRSSQLLRQTWGSSLRTTLRFGLIQLAIMIPALIVGIIGVAIIATSASSAAVAFGVVLVVIAALALIAMGMVFSAISTYARALIYRYAVGLSTPGVPADLFAGAFKPRKGRGAIA
ncbi:MAG: hypothetical protein JO147_05805, partial [Actinobacteria bacterium]|nr:hypothetical protein [Actinomycetota bacterium]